MLGQKLDDCGVDVACTGTRAGNIDPAIIEFLSEHEKLSAHEVINILNKKSGMLGISGVSSDFRDLDAAVEERCV